MAQPATPESPHRGVERATAGFVIALFLAAALLLLFLAVRVMQDVRRGAPPASEVVSVEPSRLSTHA